MNEACFQLKGSVVTVLVLEFQDFSPSAFLKQLKQKIAQAPKLLHRSPVVISLEKLAADVADIDFAALVQQCREQGLQPLGFKGEGARVQAASAATGLAVLPAVSAANASPRRDAPSLVDGSGKASPEAVEEVAAAPRPGRLISQPVRSGQQVYAQASDLIITSQVSEGAEVLADGHIHVYGPLRGRALAGVQGDTSARIFCQSLEAELLSIGGHFLLSESYRDKVWKQPAQIYLSGETLCVEPL